MNIEIKNSFELENARIEIEYAEKWGELMYEIPFISFPADFKVRILPPFGGAVARFGVMVEGNDRYISVYLDWYSRLGCVDQPYYEIYPNKDEVISRFYLSETEEMLAEIAESLKIIEVRDHTNLS